MTENEFIEAVDSRFPYDDEIRAGELIKLCAAISPNAAFMVLHEICRPPRSSKVTNSRLSALLEEWAAAFYHPLVECVLSAAVAMIQKREISTESAIRLMNRIALYANQFNALSIVYFACDDIAGEVELKHQAIISAWASTNGLEA
jgi:hypothetical protein